MVLTGDHETIEHPYSDVNSKQEQSVGQGESAPWHPGRVHVTSGLSPYIDRQGMYRSGKVYTSFFSLSFRLLTSPSVPVHLYACFSRIKTLPVDVSPGFCS